MSFEKMQLWNVLGTWFAGFGTVCTAVIALCLARNVAKVKLNVNVCVDGQQDDRVVIFVTNLGERSVTIIRVGWRIRKRRQQTFKNLFPNALSGDQHPKEIKHGELVRLDAKLGSLRCFVQEKSLKTLRLQIDTSVGHIETVVLKKDIIEELKK